MILLSTIFNSERGILAGIYGIYDGLYPNRGTSYESLSDIRDSHIWIEINDPVFMEDSTGQIHVKIKDDWYKASGVPEHRVLDFQTKKDGQNFYKFKPEFHTSKFRIEFNAIRADILSGNPDRIDYQDIYTGKYLQNGVYAIHSFRQYKRIESGFDTLPSYFKGIVWGLSTREIAQSNSKKSTITSKDNYTTEGKLFINRPILYIPFPISDHGYMFSKDILKDFEFMTMYLHDQNYYSVMTYISPDIQKIGKVISYDNNGILLEIEDDKISNLQIHLQKFENQKNHYFAFIHYCKTRRVKQISDADFQLFSNISNACNRSLKPYDPLIFINLRELIENSRLLNENKSSSAPGCSCSE